MKDINRHVVSKFAADWKDIGLELNLENDKLNIVEKDYPGQCKVCFQKTLDMWLKGTTNATWKKLEVALTNVRQQKVGLPVYDVYGKQELLRNCNKVSNMQLVVVVVNLLNLITYIEC